MFVIINDNNSLMKVVIITSIKKYDNIGDNKSSSTITILMIMTTATRRKRVKMKNERER